MYKNKLLLKGSNHTHSTKISVDKALIFLITVLIIIGSIMIYDASLIYAYKRFGSQYHFLILHIAWVSIGVVLLSLVTFIDIKKIKKYIVIAWFLTLLILIFSVISRFFFENPFVPERNYAYRWFVFNPLPFPEFPFLGRINIQPAEMFKLLSVVCAAIYLSSRKIKEQFATEIQYISIYMILFLLPIPFIALQPNLSTALIYASIVFFIPFFANVKIKYLMFFGGLIILAGLVFSIAEPYRRERLLHFLDIQKQGKEIELNDNTTQITNSNVADYHVNQILIALGSGGFTGLGIGKSRQKFFYLPEVTADSIFAIVGEELGFLGAFCVMLVLFLLIYECLRLSAQISDKFLSLICAGVGIWLLVQTSVNIAAMLRLIPITGVPVPLLSYGGSSTIFILTALGFVLNASKHSNSNR